MQVSDVGDPFGIRRDGRTVLLQMVLRPGCEDTSRFPLPAPPLRHAVQAGATHQAGDPEAATPLADIAEFSHIRGLPTTPSCAVCRW